MIAARKRPAFNFVLRRWLGRIIRRRFHGVYVFGGEHLRLLGAEEAVVGCVNHSNWWDGFVLYVLSARRLPHDIYLVMQEENLHRYRFFTWMGVFGVDLRSPRASLPGIRYALGLLRPGRLIWMFVQGRMLPAGKAIEVRPGAVFLARRTGAVLLPLVLRYEWLNESRPSVLVNVGTSLPADTSEQTLAAKLDELYRQLDAQLDPVDLRAGEPLFPPRLSMNKRWDHLVHLVLRRPGVFDKQNR